MEQKKSKPNILLIISDQQNIDSIAAYKKHFRDKEYGCHWLKTPNFDRLVKGGYSFMNSYSTNPVCSPARASIFTGRHTTENGVTYNNIGIDQNVPNMGEWFEQNSDYNRVYCGKWHAGGMWSYPDVEGARKIPGFDTIPSAIRNTGDFNDFHVSGALKGYITNYNEEKPFLAVAGFMNPHDICYWIPVLWGDRLTAKEDVFGLGDLRPPLPPNANIDFDEPFAHSRYNRTEEEWRNYLYDYCRMVEKLDADLGRLIDAVESRNDDTLIVFTADHGEGAARHKRVQKWHAFEESMKVPLIFYMPGKVKENVMDTQNIVSGIDIMPTLCDYAGIPMSKNSIGKSVMNLIEGNPTKHKHDHAVAEFLHTARMVRHGDYKFVKFYEYSGKKEKPFVRRDNGEAEYFVQGNGKERYKETGKYLLFDLKNDPWEMTDLSKQQQYAGVLENMENILIEEYEKKIVPGTNFDRN